MNLQLSLSQNQIIYRDKLLQLHLLFQENYQSLERQ